MPLQLTLYQAATDDLAPSPTAQAAPPWARYLSGVDGQWVGGGGFTDAPRDGEVEIGYFTLPNHQRQGHGRATAAALLAIAHHANPRLAVVATTLRSPVETPESPSAIASARILSSLGFCRAGALIDADGTPVWRWRNTPKTGPPR